MARLLPLVRALGKLRQLTSADTLRLPGPLDYAAAVDYTPALSAGVLNWDLVPSNTGFSTTTAAISSMTGAADGAYRVLKFAAGITLSHTANILELPGGAAITTASGDSAIFLRRSATRWQCVVYHRMSGQSLLSDSAKLNISGGQMTGPLDYAPFVAMAAASAISLVSVSSNYVVVTGSGVTINTLGSGLDGQRRLVRFDGVNTLKHLDASIMLPGAVDITTAANDLAEFYCRGGNSWRCLYYTRYGVSYLSLTGGRMTGAINYAGYVTLTAADNLAIEAVNSNTVRVDYSGGALNINAFGAGTNGTRRILYFNNTAPFTLLHDASLTVLPGNASIVPARGDFAEFQCEGGSTWRCMWYQRRDGTALVSSGGSTYTWTQASALAVWTIPHNLGRFPSVTVVDGSGVKVEPDVTYVDSNTVTVTHSAALAGKAYLN